MPLRAISGESDILAFALDASQWGALKKSYKDNSLSMPCCGNAAVPKTSPRGTYFFAHKVRSDCTTAPESAEHIYLKTVIASAALTAGWKVVTECRGIAPGGAEWIADVLCKKASASVAFEVQMSYQTVEQMRMRQERYKASGVRGAWLLAPTAFQRTYTRPSREVPCFYLAPVDINAEPSIPAFEVSLKDFVIGMLNGYLSWQPESSEYFISYIDDICFKCKGAVKQVYGYAIDVYGDAAKTVPNASTVLERMLQFISNDELRQLGLNTIGRFDKLDGKEVRFPYSNACIHCGAPQNNYYLIKKLEDAQFREDRSKMGSASFLKYEGAGEWSFKRKATDQT